MASMLRLVLGPPESPDQGGWPGGCHEHCQVRPPVGPRPDTRPDGVSQYPRQSHSNLGDTTARRIVVSRAGNSLLHRENAPGASWTHGNGPDGLQTTRSRTCQNRMRLPCPIPGSQPTANRHLVTFGFGSWAFAAAVAINHSGRGVSTLMAPALPSLRTRRCRFSRLPAGPWALRPMAQRHVVRHSHLTPNS